MFVHAVGVHGLGCRGVRGFFYRGVSTGEPDIVSLVIMSSQRAMNIYGSG